MSNKKKKSSDIYLIGGVLEKIHGHELPTNQQVLKLFFYHRQSSKQSIRDDALSVANEIIVFWEEAGIKTCRFRDIADKVIKLHGEWKNVQKNQSRKTSIAQQERETKFREKLNGLFNIAHHTLGAIPTTMQEQLLRDQRDKNRRSFVPNDSNSENTNQPSSNATIPGDCNEFNEENFHDDDDLYKAHSDHVGSQIIEDVQDDSDQNEMFNDQVMDGENDDINALSQSSVSTTGSTESDACNKLKREISDYAEEIERDPKRRKINVMTPELVSALDRTSTTSRNASHIFAPLLKSLGLDVQDYNISKTAIQENRMKLRGKIIDEFKEKLEMPEHLVIHWDGKMLSDVIGVQKVERLAILSTGINTEQLLGIPKLESPTGIDQANAVLKAMEEWKIIDCVKGLCFDTTSVNTGRKNGACTFIEKQLGRRLLYLACRHHVFEIMLRKVFETCWPVTIGPNVAIFATFQRNWSNIDTTKLKIGLDDKEIAAIIGDEKNKILEFIDEQFQLHQPRGDYRELLELAYIFLGGVPPRGIKFKAPGAAHHARWLAKAVYSLKMYMFREQFVMKESEVNGLREICIFILLHYIKCWFSAPSAVKAPLSDLTLLQNLVKYSKTNPIVANAALSKATAHLWYLSEELVALSFFDKSVPRDVKIKMKEAMKVKESQAGNLKRTTVKPKDYNSLLTKDLSDFVTTESSILFKQFQIPTEFLEKDPEEWESDRDFQHGLRILNDLKVTNDVAERGVALIQNFNSSLTKNEEQKQFLLQIVRNHRQNHPNTNIL